MSGFHDVIMASPKGPRFTANGKTGLVRPSANSERRTSKHERWIPRPPPPPAVEPAEQSELQLQWHIMMMGEEPVAWH